MLDALLLLGAALAPGQVAGGGDALQRVLDRAIERNQRRLLADVELYADHSTWERAWRLQTDGYELRITGSWGEGRAIVEGLEIMQGHFRDLLGVGVRPTRRLPVHVYPTLAEYNAYGNSANADEHSSFYGSFYAAADAERPVAAMSVDNPTLLRLWLTHSASHQWLAESFPGTPPVWVQEGLAAYFASFWDYRWHASEVETAKRGEFVPLDQLLSAGVSAYAQSTSTRFVELAMLFHYLLGFREDTRRVVEDGVVVREPFVDYLRAVVRGQDVSRHPVQLLLTRDLATLERDFLAFSDWE